MNWEGMLLFLSKLLNNHGQVPDVQANTEGNTGADPGVQVSETGSPETDQGAAETQAPTQEESFIDPGSLPDELKPHWKRMHKSYIDSRRQIKDLQASHELVSRFNSDAEFAQQVLLQRASQLGFQLVKPGQNGQATATAQPAAQNGEIPPMVLQAFQSKLPPELQWMAPSIAPALIETVKAMVNPITEQLKQQEAVKRNTEFDEHEAKLAEKHPGWEDHEDEMTKLHNWWKSDALYHPLYGSKLELLYDMATKQASAVSEAAKRMSAAAKNRTSSGQVTSSSGPNIHNIVKQGTDRDAWEAAGKWAMQQLKGQGKI